MLSRGFNGRPLESFPFARELFAFFSVLILPNARAASSGEINFVSLSILLTYYLTIGYNIP
jgi:hypothetical protein